MIGRFRARRRMASKSGAGRFRPGIALVGPSLKLVASVLGLSVCISDLPRFKYLSKTRGSQLMARDAPSRYAAIAAFRGWAIVR